MPVPAQPQVPSSSERASVPPIGREPLLIRLFRRLDDNLAEY